MSISMPGCVFCWPKHHTAQSAYLVSKPVETLVYCVKDQCRPCCSACRGPGVQEFTRLLIGLLWLDSRCGLLWRLGCHVGTIWADDCRSFLKRENTT